MNYIDDIYGYCLFILSLHDIPVCEYTTVDSPVHLLLNLLDVSSFFQFPSGNNDANNV